MVVNLGYADRLKEIARALGAPEPLIREGSDSFSCDFKAGGFRIVLSIYARTGVSVLARVYRTEPFEILGLFDFVPDEKLLSIIHYLTGYELVEADK